MPSPGEAYDSLAGPPDGAKIAYQRDGEIYVMDAGGGGQTNLTYNAADDSGTPVVARRRQDRLPSATARST